MSVTIEIENIAGNASKNHHHQKVKQTYNIHISRDIFLILKVCHFKTVRSLGMEHNIEKELLEAPDLPDFISMPCSRSRFLSAVFIEARKSRLVLAFLFQKCTEKAKNQIH